MKAAALVAAFCLAASLASAAEHTAGEEGGGPDILGEKAGGLALIEDAGRACTHLAGELRRAKPDVRVLLMADRAMTKFYARECDGACDLVETSNAVVFCERFGEIKGCVMYAALYANKVYDLSVDPDGGKPTAACGVARK